MITGRRDVPAVLAAAIALLLGLAAPAASALAQDAPQRIVSLSGPITEIVYALGEQDRLVAVDSTSLYPAEAQSLSNVGYPRQLSAEPVLSQAPDLILAGEEAGPPATLEQLADAGVRVETVAGEEDVAGVQSKVRQVATILGREEAGARLVEEIAADMERTRALLAEVESRPRVLFLLSAEGGAPMAAGEETAAQAIIDLAGGVNAVEGFSGYKPLTPEAALALAPEVILVPQHSVASLGGLETLAARPEFAATPAAQNGRVISMDSLLLLGFGPRTPEAVRELAYALHPELSHGQQEGGGG